MSICSRFQEVKKKAALISRIAEEADPRFKPFLGEAAPFHPAAILEKKAAIPAFGQCGPFKHRFKLVGAGEELIREDAKAVEGDIAYREFEVAADRV